jgi:hypothetical protein
VVVLFGNYKSRLKAKIRKPFLRKGFLLFFFCNSQGQLMEMSFAPILKMGKLRLGKFKQFFQGH